MESSSLERFVPEYILALNQHLTLCQAWIPVKALYKGNTDQRHHKCVATLLSKSTCKEPVVTTPEILEAGPPQGPSTTVYSLGAVATRLALHSPMKTSKDSPTREAFVLGSTPCQQSISSKYFRGKVFHLQLWQRGEISFEVLPPFPLSSP